jgi:hypothetical protein
LKARWMNQSHAEWQDETPPRQPGFDFSPAAMLLPTSPTPASPGPVGQVAMETPTKQLDMFGAGAMASPLQGTDGPRVRCHQCYVNMLRKISRLQLALPSPSRESGLARLRRLCHRHNPEIASQPSGVWPSNLHRRRRSPRPRLSLGSLCPQSSSKVQVATVAAGGGGKRVRSQRQQHFQPPKW